MRDPHLERLRRAKRMRTGGMTYAKIAEAVAVPNAATARNMVIEAHKLMKASKLFADLNNEESVDLYERASIERRRAS